VAAEGVCARQRVDTKFEQQVDGVDSGGRQLIIGDKLKSRVERVGSQRVDHNLREVRDRGSGV
jgi:hypothetical protein